MKKPDWLEFALVGEAGNAADREEFYFIDKIRETCTVESLVGGWIVFKDTKELWINFAVLSDQGGTFDKQTNETIIPEGECVFYGEGPSVGLRECRHTYWGDDGYIFYPDGKLIAAAFERLAEYFDDMADNSKYEPPIVMNETIADLQKQIAALQNQLAVAKKLSRG